MGSTILGIWQSYLLHLLLTLLHLFLEFLLDFRVVVALQFAVSLPAGCQLLFLAGSVVNLLHGLHLQVSWSKFKKKRKRHQYYVTK